MRLALLALVLTLPACTSVVRSTLSELERLSPVDTDPAAMTILADLPPGLGIAEGSPVLRLAATRTDPEESAEGLFILARGQAAGSETYRVAPEDLARFRALQARIRAWKAEDETGTKGQLSVSVDGCRTDAGPAPEARLSVSMQLERGGPVLPLIRPTPIKRVLRIAEVDELPAC